MIRITILVLSLLMSVSVACTSIGPGTLERDRMDYMEAISDSWKRMMLLNIVKVRYGDAPVFLEVASVINQYALETEVNANAAWNAFLPEPSQSVGGRTRYSDRPTITYNPILGHKFTKSMLEPIPVTGFSSLLQSGYSAEFLFRVCVTAINGIYNESNQRLFTREADPEFQRLIKVMTRIQQAGGLGMRLVKKEEGQASIIYLRRETSAELAEDVAEFKRLLGLDQEATEFKLTYGSMAAEANEIAILTRSMLQITAELSARVKVPEAHVLENRATPGVYDQVQSDDLERSRVKIDSSPSKPEDAFVSVHYRDTWFYINDRDYRSKRMFSFLMFIFTLVDTGEPTEAPSLTLPAG